MSAIAVQANYTSIFGSASVYSIVLYLFSCLSHLGNLAKPENDSQR